MNWCANFLQPIHFMNLLLEIWNSSINVFRQVDSEKICVHHWFSWRWLVVFAVSSGPRHRIADRITNDMHGVAVSKNKTEHYNSLQLPTVRTHTTTNTLPCFNVSNPTVLSCQLLLPLVTHAMPFTSHVPIWIIMSLASQWANCLISAMCLKLGLQFIDFKPTTVKPCLCWTLHVTMLPILSECSWCLRAALLARGNCTCTTLCRHSFAVVSSLAYKPHTIVCHI